MGLPGRWPKQLSSCAAAPVMGLVFWPESRLVEGRSPCPASESTGHLRAGGCPPVALAPPHEVCPAGALQSTLRQSLGAPVRRPRPRVLAQGVPRGEEQACSSLPFQEGEAL